jgi:acyl-CoA thioesterase I
MGPLRTRQRVAGRRLLRTPAASRPDGGMDTSEYDERRLPVAGRAVRYVALGDSYTIGTSVGLEERFPDQLIGREPRLELVANLAVNGYTSGDLIRDELPALPGLAAEFATLLIGVNDVVQDTPATTYDMNVAEIFEVLLAALPAARIIAVAIPDYTVTPAGADYGDPIVKRAAIVEANRIMALRSAERGVAFVDVFDISTGAADDRSLVADDGLHPSGAQYRRWVDRIAPIAAGLLDHDEVLGGGREP